MVKKLTKEEQDHNSVLSLLSLKVLIRMHNLEGSDDSCKVIKTELCQRSKNRPELVVTEYYIVKMNWRRTHIQTWHRAPSSENSSTRHRVPRLHAVMQNLPGHYLVSWSILEWSSSPPYALQYKHSSDLAFGNDKLHPKVFSRSEWDNDRHDYFSDVRKCLSEYGVPDTCTRLLWPVVIDDCVIW
jgi:hypothetical protein